ncbi:hypothetical protein CHUAL_011555 [Chamberlinius hualienensis]
MDLFHYTSSVGARAIFNEKVIKASVDQRYAHYGQGVYLTALPPVVGRYVIFNNNFGNSHNPALYNKTSHFFRIHARDLPNVVQCQISDGKSVYLHKGPINLSNIPWSYGPVINN